MSTREQTIKSGCTILAIGAGVTFFTLLLSSGGGTYVLAWGAILVGIIRLIRGYSMPAGPPPSAEWQEQMIGRDGPEDPTPQLAGAKCVHCAQKITSELEGRFCKLCSAPIHHDCRKDHRLAAHTAPSRSAYR